MWAKRRHLNGIAGAGMVLTACLAVVPADAEMGQQDQVRQTAHQFAIAMQTIAMGTACGLDTQAARQATQTWTASNTSDDHAINLKQRTIAIAQGVDAAQDLEIAAASCDEIARRLDRIEALGASPNLTRP